MEVKARVAEVTKNCRIGLKWNKRLKEGIE